MIWLMLVTLVVVFIIGFRVLNSKVRRATKALNRRLNLAPVYVESLISQMGKTAGGEFVDYLSVEEESHTVNAATILLIYQVFILDESDESMVFWQGVLRKANIPAEITHEQVRLALDFLRETEPEAQEMQAFRLRYNARFAPEALVIEGEYDNVYFLNTRSERH
ncbi:DUF1198 family protein [Erwinia tasmaniensis]|uniref:DUF1198 family protein n=1 Tax=Erwinia tasmaniensis TaxID=338565 RepID=UPI003A4E0277